MTAFPTLLIVPTAAVCLHESNDPGRTEPLIEQLNREGVIRNPPVIAPLDPALSCYVVLDGSNRVTAFQAMGLPHMIAQVVEYGSDQVQLSSWNHLVLSLPGQTMLTRLSDLSGLQIRPSDYETARGQLLDREISAYLDLPETGLLTLTGHDQDLLSMADLLRAIVGVYADQGKILRTQADRLGDVQGIMVPLQALVVFPRFEPADIVELAGHGRNLPAGITRHVISPRALRLNYPLSELSSGLTLEEKNRRLREWIHRKTLSQSVRYYAEATILFDE
ncbi:MAG: hypothetical protein ABSF61_01555 [Anaerolineales bacterium]|jgi:hypothetical protein